MKALKFNKKFVDISISERFQISMISVVFAAQNLRDLAIFRLKSNEQHSSIPES